MEALAVGTATVHAQWYELSAKVEVRVFPPLAIHAEDRRLVLTLGASGRFRVSGGPPPYPEEPSAHFLNLAVEKPAAVKFASHVLEEPGFRISCVALGCQKLTVSAGNKPTRAHPFPAVDTDIGEVCCEDPDSVRLSLDAPPAVGGSACPLQADKTFLVVNNRRMVVQATPLTADGRTFHNYSTALFSWTAVAENSQIASVDVVAPEPGERSGADKAVLGLGRGDGTGTVSVQVHGPEQAQSCRDTLRLRMVKAVTAVPPAARLVNHPNSTSKHELHDGSGVFAATSDKPVLLTHLKGRQLSLQAQQPGVSAVRVADICTVPPVEVTIDAAVVAVSRLEVSMFDKVEVGKSIFGRSGSFLRAGVWQEWMKLWVFLFPNNNPFFSFCIFARLSRD